MRQDGAYSDSGKKEVLLLKYAITANSNLHQSTKNVTAISHSNIVFHRENVALP